VKWAFLMLWGQMNEQMTDSVLHMLVSLLQILHQDNYQLMDFEALILSKSLYIYMCNNKDIYKINKELLFKVLDKMRLVVYSTVIVNFWVTHLSTEFLKISNEIVEILNRLFVRDLANELPRLAKI
jgi:hypothetical protein